MKKVIKKIIKNILRFVCYFVPTKNIILMESKPDFSDNTKCVFNYLISNNFNNKYNIIWVVKDSNNIPNNVTTILRKNKFKLIFYSMISKYIISCNQGILKLNPKTIALNLWHGTFIKNIKDINCIPSEDVDYVLCPSEFYKKIYEENFNLPKEKLIIFNNPRNDYLFSNKCNLSEFFNHKFTKYIIWMPTFRKSNNSRVDSNYDFPLGIPIIKSNQELKTLNNILNKNDVLLVIKPHFIQDISVFKVNELSNIKIIYSEDLLERNIELYEFLGKFDALITDYSSVYFDFLITNKPIGFTIDDFKEYSNCKGFVFENPLDYMPGMKIQNIEEFSLFIEKLKNNVDEYIDDRKNICNLVNTYVDDKNTKRVVDFLNL